MVTRIPKADVGLANPSGVRRRELTEQVADALLALGVAQIPLRDLAARIGTSDRMLLYYFDDKADLVRSSLQEVSTRLAIILAEAIPDERGHPVELAGRVMRLFASSQVAPFMRVWADISARGGRGEEPFQAFARGSVERWLAWLDARLDTADPQARRDAAAAILAIAEGVRLLEVCAPGSSRGVTAILSRGLSSAA